MILGFLVGAMLGVIICAISLIILWQFDEWEVDLRALRARVVSFWPWVASFALATPLAIWLIFG